MNLTTSLSNTSRLKAFLIHFLISLVIFIILLYFILVHWYPQPYFSTDGGWKVIRIIIGVDLILGPLLTLIIFKPGKAGLKFDLMMIALVQIVALSWGVWVSYNERPAAIIYTVDFFTPVPAYQLAEHGMTSKKLKQFGNEWPIIIFSNIPKDKEIEAIKEAMEAHKPIYLLTEYYSKLSGEHAKVLKENTLNLEKYVEDKPELKKRYQQALLRNAAKMNTSYLALHSRQKWVTAVFDLDSMRIIDTIDIEPSAYTYAQKIKRNPKKKP